MPLKIFEIRHKKKIDVVFVVSELGQWKTEKLFLAMSRHPRFSPHIAVVESMESPASRDMVIEYVREGGYDFHSFGPSERIYDVFKADIIFYQKPYKWVIPAAQQYQNCFRSVFCFVTYAFSTALDDWAVNQPLQSYAWMLFYENDCVADQIRSRTMLHGKNIRVTGIPMMDDYLSWSGDRGRPWKVSHTAAGLSRKKIVWAPHHSIDDGEGGWLKYSTFLQYCDDFVRLAKKYEDSVEFAFKPHPLLRVKLDKLWGKERTDEYYRKWESMPNTVLAEGGYIDLFMESDAMIHDSSSFTIEYMYTSKPVMYLVNGLPHTRNMNTYAIEAYNLHYMGHDIGEVEAFIRNVLDGVDPLRDKRREFVDTYLVPPGGKSACDNIIDKILGV